MFERLKKKWGLKSNWQVGIILMTFSIAGPLTLYIRRPVFELLNITAETSLWIKIPMWVIVITPSHLILVGIIGTLLGQYQFVKYFFGKFFGRFTRRKSTNS
ncbi:prolipoprotein diacylglyceryl transferase [Prolixibacteraceae bacterium JC049]|nr:prolipoprotein diacylglyceryl transferase [Prolixibacteraceae bacterium JC049]